MKRILTRLAVAALPVIMMAGCRNNAELSASFPEKFEGKDAELIDYMDSTLLVSGTITNGIVEFKNIGNDTLRMPRFATLMVDGRVKAYYIVEPGKAVRDSLGNVYGTPANDRLSMLMNQLDSVDNLDDMVKYVNFVEEKFNENKDNVIGDYLGVELLKFMDAGKIDSLLATTHTEFRDARRTKYYINLARQRAGTSAGMQYADVDGENINGSPLKLSQLIKPGQYTVLDFWASWCPYCIKELPDLESLYADYKNRGVEIVGIAVRDNPDDTRTMVKNKGIEWPVLYNTQKMAYDLYGFAGIPHHILIGPDGTIISRGENVSQLRTRLENILDK